jgi:hypothetical protein
MLAGSFIAWNRQEPFLSDAEVRAATAANAAVAGLDAGVPLAFWVNEDDDTVSFLATRTANVIRAAMPPDRIRDVVVVVPPSGDASTERRRLEQLTERDLAEAERTSGRPAVEIVLTPFDPVDRPAGARVIAPGEPLGGLRPVDPLEPATPWGIAVSSLLVLGLAWAAGYGWARVALPDSVTAAAAAPALGAAAIVLVAVPLERLGLLLADPVGGWVVSALAGGSGYAVRLVLQRRAVARAAP